MEGITLEHKGHPVTASIEGDVLVFKRGLKKKSIPLHQILDNVVESRPDNVCAADWVELGSLETRLMVHAGQGYYAKAREVLFNIVRDMRDRRRMDRGLPYVTDTKNK